MSVTATVFHLSRFSGHRIAFEIDGRITVSKCYHLSVDSFSG